MRDHATCCQPTFDDVLCGAEQTVLPVLLATRSLLDHTGGELVSTVRTTVSFCCSPARAGATATTSPENRRRRIGLIDQFLPQTDGALLPPLLAGRLAPTGGEAGSYSVSRSESYAQPGICLVGRRVS